MTHPLDVDYKEILKYYQDLEDQRRYNKEVADYLNHGVYTPPKYPKFGSKCN